MYEAHRCSILPRGNASRDTAILYAGGTVYGTRCVEILPLSSDFVTVTDEKEWNESLAALRLMLCSILLLSPSLKERRRGMLRGIYS